MDENYKDKFRMERPGFRSDSICRVEVYLPQMLRTCAVETIKFCTASSKSAFSGGQSFGKNSPPTSATHLKLSTNLHRFIAVC